jgi:3-hydroxyisobutyrate dehydrogenase-like beta-hydroxyacid dehydrogenase
LMLKDLRLSQQAAEVNGTPTRAGKLALDIYKEFVESGKGTTLDFSAILNELTTGRRKKENPK